MKKIYIPFFLLIYSFIPVLSSAQNPDLEMANEYFESEQYEKAVIFYEKLEDSPSLLDKMYNNYVFALYQLKNYKVAEKIIKKQAKNNPDEPKYKIDYALWYEVQGKNDKAEDEFEKVVESEKKNETAIYRISQYLMRMKRYDWAEKCLLTARKNNKLNTAYALELADLYSEQGRVDEMLLEYMNLARGSKDNLDQLKGQMQDHLNNGQDYEKMEKLLLQQSQNEPNEILYNELLLWLYLQQKIFDRAFVQAKSIDKRLKQQGAELFNVATIAFKNKDFKIAQEIFGYIIDKYPKGLYWASSKVYFLQAREEVQTQQYPIDIAAIQVLIDDYQKLLEETGKTETTLPALRRVALLYSFYLQDTEKGISKLEEAIRDNQANQKFVNECKLDLGDIYLLRGEPWEATLIYSQVEKDQKDSPLGYEAKLRNGKLNYYKGDFKLAQEYLDILKMATSREIANDAMNLSLFIQDNIVFDTTGKQLKAYSKVELLVFQNQIDQAFTALTAISNDCSSCTLKDDVLFLEAKLLLKANQPEKALSLLEQIVSQFGKDILADDAHFMIAKIYDEYLHDTDKAMQYYQNHLTLFKGSIYCVEARKRFRILRGDFANQ